MTSTTQQKTSRLALRFFSNATFYGLGAVLVRFGSFLVLPIYWKWLSPEDFGRITVAQIVSGLLIAIFDLGMSGSIQRHYFEWSVNERPRHLAAVWSFSFLFSLLLSLLLSFSTNYLGLFFSDQVSSKVILLGIWTAFFQNFGVLPFSLCRIQERLPLFSALSLGQFLVQTVATLIFLIPLKMGFEGYLWGLLSGAIIYGFLCLILIFKEIVFPWNWQHLKAPLYYALPAAPASILDGMGSILDRFFLQKYVPLAELGIYSLSRQFSQAYNFFQSTLKNSWVPLVYRVVAERDDAALVMSKLSSYYLLVLSFPALIIAILSPHLIYIINNPDYFSVGPYIPALVFATMLTGIGVIYGRGLDLSKKTQYYWIMYAVYFVANIGLLSWLAPKYGVWGAIISLLIASAMKEIVQIGLASYFYPKPVAWKAILTIILIQGLCYILCTSISVTSHWAAIIIKFFIICLSSFIGLVAIVGWKNLSRLIKSFLNRKIAKANGIHWMDF